MNETEFTTALHACLDARRDPLDDDALCTWLADHPEQLAAFAALRQALGALPHAAPARRRARLPTSLRLAIAAALVAAAALAVTWPAPAVAPPPIRGILAASLEEVRPRADAAVSFTVRQGWQVAPDTIFETWETRSARR